MTTNQINSLAAAKEQILWSLFIVQLTELFKEQKVWPLGSMQNSSTNNELFNIERRRLY
jgi:hypothetical protein